ncbi:MAG: hypothetical protein AAGA18_03535 [Verrucomicrobiota bacterium]
MKWLKKLGLPVAAVFMSVQVSQAGMKDMEVIEPTVEEEEIGSAVSGYVSLDFNTHFMSYGLDVWGAGRGWSDALFNPSAGLDVDLGKGFTLHFGTWWDVNDNTQDGTLSDDIQEIDLWGGMTYTYEKWSATLMYQEWIYASDSERILDLTLAYDHWLNPSLTFHGRVDGNGAQNEGVVFVPAIAYDFDLGPFGVSVPLAIGLLTEGYHVDNEGGFGYIQTGAQFSYPLDFIPVEFGEFAFNFGMYYYYTDGDNINNPDDHIITTNAGVSWSF